MNPPDKAGQRRQVFEWIAALRGLAMLLVVWVHLGSWWLSENHIEIKVMNLYHQVFVVPLHLYQEGGHLGVLIFFLVSGWVVTFVSMQEGRRAFVIKRFFRIFPVYALAFFLTWLVAENMEMGKMLGHYSNEGSSYLLSFFLLDYSLDTPRVLSVTWTLVIELFFYFLIVCFINRQKEKPLETTVYMVLIVAVIMAAASLHPLLKNTAGLLVYVFYLLLGRAAYLYYAKSIGVGAYAFLAGLCLSCYITFYEAVFPGKLFADAYPVIYSDLWGILIFGLAFYLIKKINCPGRFFANISYSTYLIHLPVGSFLLWHFQQGGLSPTISIVAAMGLVFFLAQLIYRFFERPLQRYARKIIARNP